MNYNLEEEFFKFIYERQLIWYKRFVLQENAPWTNDEVLKKYKIINVYRELDKCTKYIIEKLKSVKDRNKLFINIVFYRFFNQINLYENLKIETFDKIDKELNKKIISALEDIRRNGKPMFNNAYLITSGGKNRKKHVSIIDNLELLDIENIIDKIDRCKTPDESLSIIQEIPMVGPFLACEIWTDLSYFSFFKQGWNDNDFVNIGPGAKWGLEIIAGKKKLNKKEQKDKLNYLWKIQNKFLENINQKLKWKDIAFKEAFSNYPFLSITNIEGSLCEFRKYWNIKNGKGRRKYFHPIKY